MEPMTEAEIAAALAEQLPAGWDCIRCTDEMSVYYWNEKTDETTWLKPVASADSNIAHAQEALLTLGETADFYDFDFDEARDVADLTLRENVFIKRYFDPRALAEARHLS